MDSVKNSVRTKLDTALAKHSLKTIARACENEAPQINSEIHQILSNTVSASSALKKMISVVESDKLEPRRYLLAYAINHPNFKATDVEQIKLEHFIYQFVFKQLDLIDGTKGKSDIRVEVEDAIIDFIKSEKERAFSSLQLDMESYFKNNVDVDIAIEKTKVRISMRGYDAMSSKNIPGAFFYEEDVKIMKVIESFYSDICAQHPDEFKPLGSAKKEVNEVCGSFDIHSLIDGTSNQIRFKETSKVVKKNKIILDLIDKLNSDYSIDSRTVNDATFACFSEQTKTPQVLAKDIGERIVDFPYPMPDEEKADVVKSLEIIIKKAFDKREIATSLVIQR